MTGQMIKKAKEATVTGQTSNRILQGTNIEGEIKSDGDFRIDGKIKGNVEIGGKLVIGEKGAVEGEVKCGSASISGQFKGKLQVGELLNLEASAVLNGEVITGKLAVVPGAEFSGSCSMGAVVRRMQEDDRPQAETEEKRSERVS